MPRATFVLTTLDLKGTDTTATQVTSSCKRPFNPYIFSGHLWNLDSLKRLGPVSPKAQKRFLSRKANFQIKTCWIEVQFLAHKPVNFAWLNDSFIVSFAHYWSLNANTANINQLSGHIENRGPSSSNVHLFRVRRVSTYQTFHGSFLQCHMNSRGINVQLLQS